MGNKNGPVAMDVSAAAPSPSADRKPQSDARGAGAPPAPDTKPASSPAADGKAEAGSKAVSKGAKKQKVDYTGVPAEALPVRPYLEQTVAPLLMEGMQALVKERPEKPVAWLADWLLKHDPSAAPAKGVSAKAGDDSKSAADKGASEAAAGGAEEAAAAGPSGGPEDADANGQAASGANGEAAVKPAEAADAAAKAQGDEPGADEPDPAAPSGMETA